MPTVILDDIELYFEMQGHGEPLMLIAGLGSDSQSWLPILPELASHFWVIAPDNRGCGRTIPMNAKLSITQIADDCKQLADHLGIASFNVLGHSMGGLISLDLAIRYPKVVDKLVLAGTAAKISKRNKFLLSNLAESLSAGTDLNIWFKSLFLWLFTDVFFENEQQLKEAVLYALDYPFPQTATAFNNQVEAIIDFDCSNKLKSISANTMVINGRKDLLFSPEISQCSLHKIPNTKFVVVDDAAHSIHMEQPKVFTEIVLNFLQKNTNPY